MNAIRERVGKRLKAAREGRGLSIAKICEGLGITRQAYYRWESGAGDVLSEQLLKVCELLDVPWGLIYAEDPRPLEELLKVSRFAVMARELADSGQLPAEIASQIGQLCGPLTDRENRLNSCENCSGEVVALSYDVDWSEVPEQDAAAICESLAMVDLDGLPGRYKAPL